MPFSIEVDFEVYKELTYQRKSEADSYNNVIRRLLKKPDEQSDARSLGPKRPYVTEGVSFPAGTEFRLKHKGVFYYGKIEDGMLVVGTKRFTSVSAAGRSVTGTSMNGWIHWWCKRPGDDTYIPIARLREQRARQST